MPIANLKTSLDSTIRYIKLFTSNTSWNEIQTKTSLKEEYLSPYIKSMKEITENILDCMYREKVNGKRNNNPLIDDTRDSVEILSRVFVNFNTAVREVDTSRKAKIIEKLREDKQLTL